MAFARSRGCGPPLTMALRVRLWDTAERGMGRRREGRGAASWGQTRRWPAVRAHNAGSSRHSIMEEVSGRF